MEINDPISNSRYTGKSSAQIPLGIIEAGYRFD